MNTPLQTLEAIIDLLRQARADEDPRDARAKMAGALTHAMIQASVLKKAALREMPAHEVVQ